MKNRKKWLAMLLSAAVSVTAVPCGSVFAGAVEVPAESEAVVEVPMEEAVQADSIKPDYQWDFENVDGETLPSTGSVTGKTATLKGSAKVAADSIQVNGKAYAGENNHVLNLAGGSKGSSYVDLPSDLYEGVTAQTGMTWSFWMKTAGDVASYSRTISSANSANGNEFAYAPYASDKVWNLIFDSGDVYRQIYGSEPEKNVWNYITFTVSSQGVVFYVNGDKVSSSCGAGNTQILTNRLNSMNTLVNNALGRTYSTWSDPDCKVQLDDVAVYKTALTEEQVAAKAESYGLEVQGPRKLQDAQEGTYQDGTALTQEEKLQISSPDGALTAKIWTDAADGYYYSLSRNGKVVMECSALGLVTKDVDLTTGLTLDAASVKTTSGKESYDLLQGSSSHIEKEYKELSFTLTKDGAEITLVFRLFNDGAAYRYEMDGTATVITGENSEFSLPDKAALWTTTKSVTYEPYEYTKRTVAEQYETQAGYATPVLAQLGEDSGNCWVLLSEANVYNEENPYCASVYQTAKGEKSLQIDFGQYLVQEEDENFDQKRYSPSYRDISSVTMSGAFHTPWRVAIVSPDLEGIANSSLIADLNPAAQGDFSWVEPGSSSWSWWPTSADAIDYDTMFDYIDFAAEIGMKYCLVDYGWEIWADYEDKIRELVAYADKKDVGLLLWYGVNKFDATHIFDLDSEDAIEEAFAWCEEMGVKGVKVDYINSDSQFAMKTMYYLADIAAQHHLVLNYHGCTNPNGENRTYPNILSSEAVAGMENCKWSSGSSVSSLLTLPFTRNVLGSMEFTPTGYKVKSSPATAGLMLAMSVVYESAVQTFAHSAYVYPGYEGLSLLADVPTTWDESLLLDGYPGEKVIRARRSGKNWYLGLMSKDADTYQVKLDFLEKGKSYYAYIYNDNEDGTDITVETQKVTADSVLDLSLLAGGGCAVKLTQTDILKTTIYDFYNYYEAEDSSVAECSGDARPSEGVYSSNRQKVGYIGGGENNTLTFNHVNAKAAGTYELKLYIISGAERDLYVKVNDGEEKLLNGLIGVPGDWQAVRGISMEVELEEGENSICLYNPTGAAPDVDRIAVAMYRVGEQIPWPTPLPTPTPEPSKTPTPTPTSPPANRVHKEHVGKTFEANGLKYKVTKDEGKTREVRVTSLIDKKKKKLVIPNAVTNKKWKETFKVTTVKAKAFKGKGITQAVIGNNVTSIGPNAFLNCKKLKSVVIGKKVKIIGTRAFYGCGKLTRITVKSTVLKTVKKNAFKQISKKAVIKVPKRKKESYKGMLQGRTAKGVKIK